MRRRNHQQGTEHSTGWGGCWVWDASPACQDTEVIGEDPQRIHHQQAHAAGGWNSYQGYQPCLPMCMPRSEPSFGSRGPASFEAYGSRCVGQPEVMQQTEVISPSHIDRERAARIDRLRRETAEMLHERHRGYGTESMLQQERAQCSRMQNYQEYPDFNLAFGERRHNASSISRHEENECCSGRDKYGNKRTCDVGSDLCGDLDDEDSRKRGEIRIND